MKRAGTIAVAGFMSVTMWATPATSDELSDKSVRTFMSYAWTMVPQRFTPPNGKTVIIDKSKPETVAVPVDIAREIIRVGRLSAHAQICDLPEDQTMNYRSLMKREQLKEKWTPQQMVFINQLHLTTVMLLTGKIKVTVKDGDKEVVIDDGSKAQAQTCSDEQKTKVKEVIAAYIKTGPDLASAPANPQPQTTSKE